VEAAVAIDAPRLQQALDTAFALVAPETVVCKVLEPAASAIGELWASGQCSVAGEHLASQAFIARLHRLIEARNTTHPTDSPAVLCACLPGERHEIGALVLAFFLARTGMRVSYLGPDLPLEDIDAAVTRLEARAVYLSVTRSAVLDAHRARLLDLVERRGGEVVFLIGGRGVTGHEADLLKAGARLWPEARSVWELETGDQANRRFPAWRPPAVE
jgi:methanogenic corrinoid protein MtbC1